MWVIKEELAGSVMIKEGRTEAFRESKTQISRIPAIYRVAGWLPSA
jgi:hypothetical protein